MQLGQKGNLVARLANNDNELVAAQHLRYQIFYNELSAVPDSVTKQLQLDVDEFDEICDHLLVVRQGPQYSSEAILIDGGELVGTYRLLRQQVAEQSIGFYSQGTFELSDLIVKKPGLKFLEVGRSCVRKAFRTRPVMELLWQGIWNYLRFHEYDVMTGCASFAGNDMQSLKLPLSFLHHNCAPPTNWTVRPHKKFQAKFDLLPSHQINDRTALKALPPLIKAYLRLGAYIAQGAVVDNQFNTTDVLILLPVTAIDPRYFAYFGTPHKKTARSEFDTGG